MTAREDTSLPPPTLVADRFRGLLQELLVLLRGLAPEQWHAPTSAHPWTVRDVVAHLLDIDIRRLSIARDGVFPPSPAPAPADDAALVAFLDALNAEWVRAARRASPRVLCDLLELTGGQIAVHMESLDPFARAPLPVAWAGEAASANWLDTGREFTERWHHQDQIRAAVGAAPLDDAATLAPVIDISLRALPHAYRTAHAPGGTTLVIDVRGAGGGMWSLVRRDGAWRLGVGAAPAPTVVVTLEALDAARVLLHRMRPAEARERARVTGDAALAEPFFRARAVMVREPAP